jgi:hypothetical protein
VFRRRHRRKNGQPSAEASLAQAEAARRDEESKLEAERPVKGKLDRLIEENHLAELLRKALG